MMMNITAEIISPQTDHFEGDGGGGWQVLVWTVAAQIYSYVLGKN